MPRYFFDIEDGVGAREDDTGSEFTSLEDVRKAAISILPDVAREEIPTDGDRRQFTVVVTDESGKAIYSATLSFAGLWLSR